MHFLTAKTRKRKSFLTAEAQRRKGEKCKGVEYILTAKARKRKSFLTVEAGKKVGIHFNLKSTETQKLLTAEAE